MIKKIVTLISLFTSLQLSASHLMGGMLGVFQTSQDSTTVGMWLISDSQGLPMPTTVYVEKWEMNNLGWYVQNGTITLTQGTASMPFQGQLLTNYTSEYLDLDSNKYRFIYKNCCWGVLNNSFNSMNSEFIISADYWHIPYNSTPYAREPFIINQQNATRNTMKPLWGWNAFLVNPDTWDNATITQSDLYMGYANGTFVQQSFTPLTIHVDDDSISFAPNFVTIGNYGTGFEIKDIRNGQVIGIQRIQWTFRVLPSTVGIEENIVNRNTRYEVYDWSGRYMGDTTEHLNSGWYVIKYDDGRIEKLFLN